MPPLFILFYIEKQMDHQYPSHQEEEEMSSNHQYSSSSGDNKPVCLASTARRVSYKDEELKSACKSVSFNESVTVHPILDRPSMMSLEERNRLYYSGEDTRAFRSEVKALCVRVIGRARSNATTTDPNMTSEEHISAILAAEPMLRGLEKYTCPQRMRNKSTVISSVLKYHKHLSKSSLSLHKQTECLAEAYSKLAYWSLTKALEIARTDFVEVYGEQDLLDVRTSRKRSAEDVLKNCDKESADVIPVWTDSNDPLSIEPFPKLTRKRRR